MWYTRDMKPFILKILFFTTLLASPIWGSEPFALRQQMEKVVRGDFVVSYQNKAYTLMHAYERSGSLLDLEEITVPSAIRQDGLSWKEWMLAGAPGHTSRVMYRVDLSSGEILSYYSFTESVWLAIDRKENLFSQLIAMELSRVPEAERRRRGPRPTDGPDGRLAWQPALIYEGERQTNASFAAWKGHWPKDGSELSNKEVLVYLPEGNVSFLQGFPYWLEISGGVGRAHFRVVDSGKEMQSILAKPRKKQTLNF